MTNGKRNAVKLNLDLLTIVSMSIVVFVIQNVLHEFVGHGGATILVGGKLVAWTTAYLDHDLVNVSDVGRRMIAAAGPVINLLVGLLFWYLLRGRDKNPDSMTFFMWLMMAVNLMTGTGSFFFSGASGMGDLAEVVRGAGPMWIWRIGMIIAGMITYAASIWISLNEMNPFIGTDDPGRNRRAMRLSLIPYLAGSIASTIGAFFNPMSMIFVITSAVSTFGGSSGLAWMTQLYSTKLFTPNKHLPIMIRRNWIWVVVGVPLLAIHIFVIGPGINF